MLCPCPLLTRTLKKTKTTTVQMSRTTAYLGGGKAAIPWRTTHHHVSVLLISLRKTDLDRATSPEFRFSSQPTPCRVQLWSRNSCFSDKMLKYLVNSKMPPCRLGRTSADWCREPSPTCMRVARLPEKGGKMLS